jgi:hypothetical protein
LGLNPKAVVINYIFFFGCRTLMIAVQVWTTSFHLEYLGVQSRNVMETHLDYTETNARLKNDKCLHMKHQSKK